MKRFGWFLLGLTTVGCASEATNGDGGAGGTGTSETVTVTSSVVTTSVVASSSGTGGPCGQDCSTIEVPACFEATCNSITHACEIKAAADETPCEDGLFCTVDDKCESGICQSGGPMVCTPEGTDPCVTSICDEENATCSTAPAVNGTSCTSTDICQTDAICQNGHCLGAQKDCSSTPLPDDCHVAGCEPVTGNCIVLEANDGDACLQGDPCEADKVCTAGVCGGTPIVGCTLCGETEQNGTIATANVDLTCSIWQGAISVIGDHDFYGVHVAVDGSRIDAEVNDLGGAGTCPPGFEATVTVFSPTGVNLASDTFDGVFPCGHVGPTSLGATNLPAGDYFVEVSYDFDSGTSSPYLLTVNVLPPGCGNDVVENTEACDGPALDGQNCVSQGFGSGTLACDSACTFDTSGCSPPFCGDGLIQPIEDCEGFDLGGGTCATAGFGSGTLSCNPDCSYNTSLCNPPACGDGILQPGEECDDGNTLNGDACSSTCTLPACTGGATKVTLTGTGLPIAIPDATFPGISNIIHVAQVGTIQSVWVTFNITHTFEGDLVVNLTPPAASAVSLVNRIGVGGDNFVNTTLSSLAANPVTAGVSPFTGIFAPQGSFAPAIGTAANGNWTIYVEDQAGADIGTLDSWSLTVCVQ